MPSKGGRKEGAQQQTKQPAPHQPVRTNKDEMNRSGVPGDWPRPRARKRRSSTLLRYGQPSGPASKPREIDIVPQTPRIRLTQPRVPISTASRVKLLPSKRLGGVERGRTPSPPESSARSNIS